MKTITWADFEKVAIYVGTIIKVEDFPEAKKPAYKIWVDWFRLREIERKVDTWKTTVRSLGGPWIVSNDPDLHVFVYADGMERIKYSRVAPRPSRKTEKTSPKAELPVQSQASSLPKSP